MAFLRKNQGSQNIKIDSSHRGLYAFDMILKF